MTTSPQQKALWIIASIGLWLIVALLSSCASLTPSEESMKIAKELSWVSL